MGDACSSCKTQITNLKGNTRFNCPGCSKVQFIRCSSCRSNAVRYACQECGFSGPN